MFEAFNACFCISSNLFLSCSLACLSQSIFVSPVPAGTSLPTITFSFKPSKVSILPLIEAGHEVHLNLSKVEYMDSSGISVLVESKKLSEQKNTKFELVEVSKPVEKVLAMARKFL